MHKRLFCTLLFFGCVVFLGACASTAGNMDIKSSFSTSSENPTLEQVGRKIITACSVKGWRPELLGAGHINAIRRRGGYVANIDIFYTTDSFEIKYKGSDTAASRGTEVSSTYSNWVEQLSDEIERRLSEL